MGGWVVVVAVAVAVVVVVEAAVMLAVVVAARVPRRSVVIDVLQGSGDVGGDAVGTCEPARGRQHAPPRKQTHRVTIAARAGAHNKPRASLSPDSTLPPSTT